MADTKISALTSASTPLAGTEVLPIVQSGVTVKVSVDNLTTGKAVSAATLNLTGKATVGTAVTTVGLLINTTNDSAQIDYKPTGADRYVAGAGILATNDWGLYNVTQSKAYITANGGALGGNITINIGNLIQGTAAKGIDRKSTRLNSSHT
mgnify:CR=1 FL=1